ncbi:MAG: 1-acyl-sn-glycerol-3-phosphate acyltransferase, partial [Chloroflexota bacterium]|nr:1-acyl-sn-glycerol-3-phosphate acyltransferase [Chloroflexota bacterium]
MSQGEASLAYRVLRVLIYWFFRLTMKIDAEGLERVPQEGPLLVTANHTTVWEAPLILALFPRAPLTALAKVEWKSTPVVRWILDIIDVIYV